MLSSDSPWVTKHVATLFVYFCVYSQEQELKKQKEFERQLEKQRQMEMEREEERRKAMEQREVCPAPHVVRLHHYPAYCSLLLQVLLLLLLPFNGVFSRTTWVSWYQKGKTSLDLSDARDDRVLGWQWHQLDHMQTICTSLQTNNHVNTSSLNFCSSQCPTNSVKALKDICYRCYKHKHEAVWFQHFGWQPMLEMTSEQLCFPGETILHNESACPHHHRFTAVIQVNVR